MKLTQSLAMATVIIAGATTIGSATASDLKGSPFDIPAAQSRGVNWTGIYLGALAGYGNANHNLEADFTQTETTPAYCKEGALKNNACYKTENVPAVPEKCDEGTTLLRGKCYKTVTPATPASCAEGTVMHGDVCVETQTTPAFCGEGYKLANDGACYLKGGVKGNGDPKSGYAPVPEAYHQAVTTETGAIDPDAYTPATEATGEDEVADAHHDAIDATTKEVEIDGAFVAGETVKNMASAFIDGINSHGLFGGGTIGADWQTGPFVLGLFADYHFDSLETEAGLSVDGVSLGTADIKHNDSWLVAARAGYLFSQRALLYGLVGYGQSDVSYSVAGLGGAGTKDLTFSGVIVGAGAEYALTPNIFFSLEYQHFFGSKETLVDEKWDGGSLKVTDEMDSDKVMAKLKFKLNGER